MPWWNDLPTLRKRVKINHCFKSGWHWILNTYILLPFFPLIYERLENYQATLLDVDVNVMYTLDVMYYIFT